MLRIGGPRHENAQSRASIFFIGILLSDFDILSTVCHAHANANHCFYCSLIKWTLSEHQFTFDK